MDTATCSRRTERDLGFETTKTKGGVKMLYEFFMRAKKWSRRLFRELIPFEKLHEALLVLKLKIGLKYSSSARGFNNVRKKRPNFYTCLPGRFGFRGTMFSKDGTSSSNSM